MSNFSEQSLRQTMTFSRNILRNVYIWMTAALAITGLVAWGISQNLDLTLQLMSPGIIWGIMIAEVLMVIILSRVVFKLNPIVATLLFALYSVINGVSLSFIFLAYELGAIYKAFFITAGLFGAMSVYAVGTKRDLSGWGHYLFMGLIGLVIAMVVNLFLQSGPMDYLISVIGVVLFTLLTAYDTQKIKRMSDSYSESVSEPDYIRISIAGALTLYLDFINMFLYILRIFGNRR